MHSVWLGEFLGTFILILMGSGVCASTTLNKAYAQNAGWIVVTAGWAFAVLSGVLTAQAFGSSGAHLNPAITFANAIYSGDFSQLALYWSAQLLGAMAGATLTFLIFYPHWAITPDPAAKLGIFCTSPAIPHQPPQRSHGRLRPRPRRQRHRLPRRLPHRTRPGRCPPARRLPGLGHRPLPRLHHRLRHQPRPRPRSPPHALPPPHPWQRRLQLALRLGPHRRRPRRSRPRRPAPPLRPFLDIRRYLIQN